MRLTSTTVRDQLPIDYRLGNYRIERFLRPGVYHAVHSVLPRRVVLKVGDASMLREAVILEALHHPGIVRVFECGVIAAEPRQAWFARELADGPTLASILAPGAIDRVDATRLLRDLAEVIDHAHRRGVIHGGLRPSRIVMCSHKLRGFPLCLVDWSDARAHDALPAPYIAAPDSWHYASPELACGDPIDDRVDVFALGVIAYQLLTGTLPFAQRAVTHDDTQHVPTEVHCPDVPRELTTLVDQMLAYDQWDRPSSAEIHAALVELVELVATPAPLPSLVHRIRKPRWTPGYVPAQDDRLTPPPVLDDRAPTVDES